MPAPAFLNSLPNATHAIQERKMLSSCTWASDLFVPEEVSAGRSSAYLKGRARKNRVSGSGRRDKPQYEAALTRLLAVAQPTYTTTLPTCHVSQSSSLTPESLAAGVERLDVTAAWLEDRRGLDPAEGHLCNAQRARRKRQQVANLMQACRAYIEQLLVLQRASSSTAAPLTVIEFCCGSGHVALPLAALYPSVQFILIDNRPPCIHQAKVRAATAHLENVTCRCADVHDFSPTEHFHLGIGLHACGPLTDFVLELCLQQRAAYVLCPCCIGKVQSSPLEYPRSSRFRALFPDRRQYESMASAADLSVRQFFFKSKNVEADKENTSSSSSSTNGQEEQEQELQQQEQEQQQQHRRRRLCKTFVEMDRGFRAEEAGYVTRLMLLTPRECTPKNDLLCGYPSEWGKGLVGEGEGDGEGVRAAKEEVEHVVVNGDDAAVFDAWFGDSGTGREGGDDASSDEDEDD